MPFPAVTRTVSVKARRATGSVRFLAAFFQTLYEKA
ncbi:hypothetical protein BN8_02546 [Fibrisoma limi BUZ 3]|uniref:Uncharacterized protein n=1 Tax=Fibrisoma limi BUZ 3 TaxID=1185876 RepID=I2GHS5_9BACT|nr:hypothetical protein BN8_02546 [Fibrisoma limi BUZ 3]